MSIGGILGARRGGRETADRSGCGAWVQTPATLEAIPSRELTTYNMSLRTRFAAHESTRIRDSSVESKVFEGEDHWHPNARRAPIFLKSVLKNAIAGQLESRGLEIVRREARNGQSIPLLPLLIERCALVEGRRGIIQIGANDGLMDDPVRKSIVSLGLPALLVEPLPDLFERLQSNYSDRSDIVFANVAVSEASGQAEIFRVRPSAKGFPKWVHGLASFDKGVLLKHRNWQGVDSRDFDAAIESVLVPVITMTELLARHPEFRSVILLQIDTEGHDYAVVRSAVSAGCLPQIINYEHKHLSYSDQVACRELLSMHGYAFWANAFDTLAYRLQERQTAKN